MLWGLLPLWCAALAALVWRMTRPKPANAGRVADALLQTERAVRAVAEFEHENGGVSDATAAMLCALARARDALQQPRPGGIDMGVTLANLGVVWTENGTNLCGMWVGQGNIGLHDPYTLGPMDDPSTVVELKAWGAAAHGGGTSGLLAVLNPSAQAWFLQLGVKDRDDLVAHLAWWHQRGWSL